MSIELLITYHSKMHKPEVRIKAVYLFFFLKSRKIFFIVFVTSVVDNHIIIIDYIITASQCGTQAAIWHLKDPEEDSELR